MSLINQISNLTKGIQLLEKYSTDGDIQPHEAFLLLKESGIEELFKEVMSNVKSVAIENLKNNFIDQDKKSFKDANYMYTVRQGATRYYFTDVPEVKEAESNYKNSEPYLKYKEIENKYKTAFLMKQKNQIMVDEETGEVIDPSNVNVVYSPDSLSIKKL